MKIPKIDDPLTDLDRQIAYVRDFLVFLKKNLEHTTQDFEKLQGISGQELIILIYLAQRSDLTVKDISQHLSGVSLSTLTRLLDSLEEKQYVVRSLNPDDRRSFIVKLTDAGQQIVEGYQGCMEQYARLMLNALSPAERLMLIELYAKTWQVLSASEDG